MPPNSTRLVASSPSQVSFYVGINLQDILYGIELCFYFKTMHIFLARRRTRHKSDMFYGAFSTMMLLLVTTYVALVAHSGQEKWLPNQKYPNGPPPYGGITDATAVSSIALQQMTDGLMMYRCRKVWNSLRAIVLPLIVWLATLVLAILVLWVSSAARTSFFSGDAAKLSLAYYSTSVFLNTTLTCMICYRLLSYAKFVKESLGDHHASPYFSVTALLVESILPYTMSGIALLISYAAGSGTEVAFCQVYTVMTAVSSQMLILHVAEGKGWRKDTIQPPISEMRFPSGCGDTSGSGMDGSEAGIHLEALPGASAAESAKKDCA